MKKRFILAMLLLICSHFIEAQCDFPLVTTVITGCAPLEVLFNYPSVNSGTVTWSVDTTTVLGYVFSYTFNLPAIYTITLTLAVSNPTGVCVSSTTRTINVLTGPANGCSSTVINGIKEQFNENNLLVYPNPGNGTFKVELYEELRNPLLILVNALGQKVYEEKLNRGSITIQCPSLAKGIYSLCLLQDGKSISRRKLVIE